MISLKKKYTKGNVAGDDGEYKNDADTNGGGTDPSQGNDELLMEVPKKTARKKNVPELIGNNDDADFEVEDILDHKFEMDDRYFLVRWKNFGPEDDTWEPESSLSCPDIVRKYVNNNPDLEMKSSGGSRKRPANMKAKSNVPAKKSKGYKKASNSNTKNAVENDDGNNVEYEVEDIVDHKIVKGETLFRIRWKNFDSSDDTWEAGAKLSLSCPVIIERYKDKKMKDTPKEEGSKQQSKPKKEKAENDREVQVGKETDLCVQFFVYKQ